MASNILSAKEIRRGSLFLGGGRDHCESGCMVFIPLTFLQTKSSAYELYKSYVLFRFGSENNYRSGKAGESPKLTLFYSEHSATGEMRGISQGP